MTRIVVRGSDNWTRIDRTAGMRARTDPPLRPMHEGWVARFWRWCRG